jgi:hypothetical protein
MPDFWMDVDVALGEVPVNIMPLLDDTDFKTRETAVAYNAAGMDLVWNFLTPNGSFTQTAVTPTTGGNYDWTHQGDGMYTIEIPASGGASINNDTEGFGWFSGVATGVLPWRGPVIGFRASGLNDLLIESAYSATRGLAGTALPAVAAEAAGGLYTRGSGAGQINQQANGQIDTNPVRLNNVAQSLLDLVDFADAGYDPATNKVQGVALVDTLTTYTGNTPQTGDAYIIVNNGTHGNAALKSLLDTIAAYVDTEVAAIKAKTDNLPSDPADQSAVEAAILAAWTTALTESYAADGAAPTPAQALMLIMQRLTEFAKSGAIIAIKKLNGTDTAAELTLDDADNPTSSTRSA